MDQKLQKEIEFSISSRLPTSINSYFLCTWDDDVFSSVVCKIFSKKEAIKRNDITSNAHNNAYFQINVSFITPIMQYILNLKICLKGLDAVNSEFGLKIFS